jgi:vacuolar-type H+-ATPase subunit F/Vma7
MITLAGGRNVFAPQFKGWKNVSLESVIALAPEVVVCQCKPEDARDAEAYWNAVKFSSGKPHRVVIVTDAVAAGMRAEVDALRAGQPRPLVVEIPGPAGPMRGRKTLHDFVQEAIGIRLGQKEET